MLHLLLVIVGLLLMAGPGVAADPAETRRIDVVSAAQRARLQVLLSLRTVTIERRARLQDGMAIPGGQVRWGRGWIYNASTVLTSAALVANSEFEKDAVITVAVSGQTRLARVASYDARTGAAVLRLNKPLILGPNHLPTVAPEAKEIWKGRPAFAAGTAALPSRLVMELPIPGPFAFYWTAVGDLPLGAPLTDATGRLLTLVGLRHQTLPGTLLLLPPDAVKAVVKKAGELGK